MPCKFSFNSNLLISNLGFFQNEVSQGQTACTSVPFHSQFNLIKNSDPLEEFWKKLRTNIK